jgi:hypothetical protein
MLKYIGSRFQLLSTSSLYSPAVGLIFSYFLRISLAHRFNLCSSRLLHHEKRWE